MLAAGLGGIFPDSLAAAYALLTLILADELGTANRICDTVLDEARKRGSMSMVAHASCSRSMLMRRLGQLDDAADDAQLALGFKLATSPPLAVAWAAAFCIDALTCLGRLADRQHLFISRATVETHLRHAFQKLGITFRASLPPLAHPIAAPAQLRS